MTQGSDPSLPSPRRRSCLLLPPLPQGSAHLLQPLQPLPALQSSQKKSLVRARRRNSKGQFQRGAACALCVCVRAVLGSGGSFALALGSAGAWFECSEGLVGAGAATEPWEGPELPYLAQVGGGKQRLADVVSLPQTRTPLCCWTLDVRGPHPSVTVPLTRGPATLWIWITAPRSKPAPCC